MLKGKTVVLGVTGSIAAYKIANLASMLVKQHADVNVIMTHNATNFINPITFELSQATSASWTHLTETLNSTWSMWLLQREQTSLWWHLHQPM